MKIKIVERKKVLEEFVVQDCAVVSIFDVANKLALDYILKDIIIIKYDDSEIAKKLFENLVVDPREDVILIEVELAEYD